jgi:hypothetical protein
MKDIRFRNEVLEVSQNRLRLNEFLRRYDVRMGKATTGINSKDINNHLLTLRHRGGIYLCGPRKNTNVLSHTDPARIQYFCIAWRADGPDVEASTSPY